MRYRDRIKEAFTQGLTREERKALRQVPIGMKPKPPLPPKRIVSARQRRAEAGAFALGWFPALFIGMAGTKWNGVLLAALIIGAAVWVIWWHSGNPNVDR